MASLVPRSASSQAVLATLAWTRKQGFKAVALHPASKAAIDRKYVDPSYSTPPDDLWRSRELGIGVVTGPLASGPVDIDLDCPEAMFFATRFLPPTPAVFGRKSKPASHYFYRVAASDLDKQAFLDPVAGSTIIEIRADGGHQTVLPGSTHQDTGELIEWTSVPFPDVPQVEADALRKGVRQIALAALIARHLWLEGQRNEVVKHVAGLFFYLDWPVDEAIALIEAVAEWNGDDDRTRRPTVLNTYKKAERGGKVTGAATLRKLLGDDRVVDRILEWAGSPTVNLLQEYNSRFSTVSLDGKFRIADFDVPPGEPPVFYQKDDFLNVMATDYTLLEGKNVSKARIWLNSPRRRQASSVDFLPGLEDSGRLVNLWTGWALQPRPGNCSAWLELLEHVICGDDPALTNWMLNWFANILREPRHKSLTAPVIIGRQGAGKSILLTYFGRILGRGFTTVTNEEHIYGRFNRHLGTTLLLHSEEALYGGEKRHRGIIKSMITDDWRIFEQKGVDAKQVSNFLRLALTSNEAHAAPAEPDDRRFTVIDMDNRKISGPHIERLVEEMKGGGPEALFDHLINKFPYDPAVPRTNVKNEALASMKRVNLDPMSEWWMNVLQVGVVLPDFLSWATRPEKEAWPGVVSSSALYTAMVLTLRDRSVRNIPSESLFALQLNKFVGMKLQRAQRTFNNAAPDDAPTLAKLLSSRQNAILNFPTLDEARKAFTAYLGQAIVWNQAEPASEKPLHEKY